MIDCQVKEGKHVHDGLVVLPTSFCDYLFTMDDERNTKCFCDNRIVCVAGRAWAVRVDSGGILLFIYSIIWSYSEQKPKGEYFSVL